MNILQTLGLQRVAEAAPVEGSVLSRGEAHALDQVALLTERLVDLQREDRGWESLTRQFANEVDRAGLTRNADLVRISSIMNPLMKRGKHIRASYVFGQGVEVTARQEDDGQEIDAVAQQFLQDESNTDAVFGQEAAMAMENDLFDDGNVFVAHFVDPLDGKVQVRPFPFDEIVEIISDPGDRFTPQFYKRVWNETTLRDGYSAISREMTAYYPALKHQPLTKLKRIGEHPVMWPGMVGGAAVYHIKVNPLGRDRTWGIGDGFAAMPWARGYKEFLEDWAMLMKALSRIAGVFKDKAGTSQQVRAAVQATQMGPAGGMAYTGQGEVEFPSKSGATLDSESGRPLAAMVAAALGVAVTILLADPGTTGARAVAETLDRPMRLEMMGRQNVHAEFRKASVGFALEQSVLAPRGVLRGKVSREGDRLKVLLDGDLPPTVEVVFPPLEEEDMKTSMESLQIADDMDLLPPLVKLKAVASALKLRDVADLIDQVTDDEGNFVPPSTTAGEAAGDAAAAKLRSGGNPADVL